MMTLEDEARARLIDVLVAHQRRDTGSCLCGWGERPEHLGLSHCAHMLDKLTEHKTDLLKVASTEDAHEVKAWGKST